MKMRGALAVDRLDDLEDLVDEMRRQSHRGLVHAQQARPRHQRARHRDHLLLASRQRTGDLVEAFADAWEQAEHPLEIGCDLCLVDAGEGAHLEILEHRHAREQAARFGHGRDAAADPLGGRERVDDLAA